jgi:hypothetical protein
LALADQLTQHYKDHESSGNADSYAILCEHITTLQDYFKYKNELFDHPQFVQQCEAFDIKVKPITEFDILVALREHPLAGSIEWNLFDEFLCIFYY